MNFTKSISESIRAPARLTYKFIYMSKTIPADLCLRKKRACLFSKTPLAHP